MHYLDQFRSMFKLSSDFSNYELPLSAEQYAIWLEQELYPNDVVNHAHFVAEVDDCLDVDAFQRAVKRLAEQHEVIRTIFPVCNGVPLRRVMSSQDISFQVIECADLPKDAIFEMIEGNFKKPFNLEEEFSHRFCLYRVSSDCYYLQVIQHHIATALSYAYLIVELVKLYALEKKGCDTCLHLKQSTFSDFVCKRWQHLQSEKSLENKEYWKHYLSGQLPLPILPAMSMLPTSSSFLSRVQHFDLEPELVSKLTQVCKDAEVTFFSLVVAAFEILLCRYTDQNEIIIGVPTDTRREIRGEGQFESVVGYTTNTLPLRTRINKDESCSQLLKRVRADLREMSVHKNYPLIQIKEDLRQEHSQSVTDLFRALVVSQRMDEYKEIVSFGVGKKNISLDVDGVKLKSTGIGFLPAGRFDLALALVKTCQGDVISFHYNGEVFDEKFIQLFFDNYETLLRSIAEDPNKKLSELESISKSEKKVLLEDWAFTEKTVVPETFLEQFARSVEKTPEAIAITCGQEVVDYQTLNILSDKLAKHLIKLDVNTDAVIGISVKRSIKLIASILAVMKCGGTFLPIDPSLPQERILFMLEDSRAKLLLTESQYSLSKKSKIQSVHLDVVWEAILQERAVSFERSVSKDHLAYILYTSGSTGKPKGVEVYQRSLDNFLAAIQKKLQLSGNDQWLALTTVSFDISLLEILLPLAQGAKVLFVDQEIAKDPILLAKTIEENAVTHMQATPTTWQMLLNADWKGKKGLTALCGGEALDKVLAEKLLHLTDELWNMYGPTETTIWSSMKELTPPVKQITIGRPIANTSFYVLDEEQQIVPIGVPGELCIGGAGLAQGYRNLPDLSQEKFIPSPFASSISSKLYRTGDIVRYSLDGEIEFIGRSDGQVKLHGYRIELGEIEESIKTCPDIKQAVVLIREDIPSQRHLIAYYVGAVNPENVKQHLADLLPHYMLPHFYVQLDQFPTSSSGKLDRKALPLPNFEELKESYIGPRDALEEEVAKVIAATLGINRVGIHDNFFSLGGHSLAAAKAVSEINRSFYINLPLKVIFKSSSVELLANEVRLALSGKKSFSQIVNVPEGISIPLTTSQNQFLFLDQLQEGTTNYTIPLLIDLKGPLDCPVLDRALDEIVSRHSALRTHIAEVGEEVEQKISARTNSKAEFVDLSCCNYEEAALQKINELVSQPFDLYQGPLFRFVLLRENKAHHQLLLQFHHIIFDGYSVNVFLNELKTLYDAYKKSISSPLQPLQIQYSDYACWQHRSQNAPSKDDLLWWTERLKSASCALNIPTDRPRPLTLSSAGALLELQLLTKEELNDLKQLGQGHKATLFMVLLAAFHLFLYRYTGESDTIIGVPISGRSHSQLDNLIGCFVNTLPIRVVSNSCEPFCKLLEQVKNELLASFEHQEIALERLVDQLTLQRSLSSSSLFQVMFNLLPETSREKISDLEVTVSQLDRGCAHLDLSLTAQETEEGLNALFEYSTDLFVLDTIERMGSHFQNLLRSILKDSANAISELSLLSDTELETQISEWNSKSENYTDKETVPQLVEKWALNTPDAIAVVCGSAHFTFAELNAFANQAAHHLLRRGIQKEDRVAVYAERSVEFIGSILGILKAGAAYIPIDPKEPKNRRDTILNELQPFAVFGANSSYSNELPFKFIGFDEIASESTSNPSIDLSGNQLAYIIFTSGSTGKPKGVEIEHQSLCDRVHWKNAKYSLTQLDSVLHTYSFIFDGAVINYFWPICFGAKLIISSSEEQYDSTALVSLINKHHVTVTDLLPSLLNGLLEDEQIGSCQSLRIVFSGGEALSGEIVKLFYQSLSARLVNTYGPTEATVEASAFECSPSDNIYSVVPIGRQIAGANLYILDKDKNIVPIGVPGELYIGGKGLARGYFKNPLLTSEKFIDQTFASHVQERLYRTGDLVRYQANGNVEFLGRIDNQIKIRGFRVEIGEIEETLLQLDPIEKAVVAIRGDSLHKQLVAYVILSLKMPKSSLLQLVKHYLSNRLPAYMIPQNVVIVDRFPTLPNGKVSYKDLPNPILEKKKASVLQSGGCKTRLEIRMHECWSQVLHCDQIGKNENFFELGGNSLLAMKLISRLKRELSLQIPLAYIFQHPTIASLAEKLEQNVQDKWSPLIKLCERGSNTPFFIVHPIGGGVLCYNALARNWNIDRSLYAIQAIGLEGGQVPLSSVEAMARVYIEEIRRVQPKGPYLIGGWSFGGIIAAEIVNQLTRMKEAVDLLLLIDTSANIGGLRHINLNDDSLLLAELSEHYLDAPMAGQANLSLKERLACFIESGGERALNHENGMIDRLVTLARANYSALQAYYIPFLKTKVALVRAQHNSEKSHDLGWGKYVNEVFVYTCPGNHWAVTSDQYASQYADAISHCLSLNLKLAHR